MSTPRGRVAGDGDGAGRGLVADAVVVVTGFSFPLPFPAGVGFLGWRRKKGILAGDVSEASILFREEGLMGNAHRTVRSTQGL